MFTEDSKSSYLHQNNDLVIHYTVAPENSFE